MVKQKIRANKLNNVKIVNFFTLFMIYIAVNHYKVHEIKNAYLKSLYMFKQLLHNVIKRISNSQKMNYIVYCLFKAIKFYQHCNCTIQTVILVKSYRM